MVTPKEQPSEVSKCATCIAKPCESIYDDEGECWNNPTPYISEWQKTIEMVQDEKDTHDQGNPTKA